MPTDGSWTTRTDFECRVPLPNDLFPSVVHAAPLVSRDRMIENTVGETLPGSRDIFVNDFFFALDGCTPGPAR